jgi:hypothetical protein
LALGSARWLHILDGAAVRNSKPKWDEVKPGLAVDVVKLKLGRIERPQLINI